jgi:hypothetical protein
MTASSQRQDGIGSRKQLAGLLGETAAIRGSNDALLALSLTGVRRRTMILHSVSFLMGSLLTPNLAAKLVRGFLLLRRICSRCHRLFCL